ncbi:MAG TPA: serine hydrolase domain-containing protein [Streptosporangiaceae bacterium]
MKPSRRSALGLLGAAPLAASGALSPSRATSRANSSTASRVTSPAAAGPSGPPPALLPGGAYDRFVRGLAGQDKFSGTVLLAWRGEPVLVRSYQMADKALDIPNQADTIFLLASLTKFFTGVAVTQLAAQGKIDFYATLGSYLDGFPAVIADTVTVHQLLTHTSGVPDFSMSAAWKNELPGWTTNTEAFNGTLSFLQHLPLSFTPGTAYIYSNSNFFLAGAIVAQASGQAFWDYVPRHIFGPAGMTSTAFVSAQQQKTDPRIAHNYSAPLADGQHQDLTSHIAVGPNGWDGAGGAFSTAPDLLRFVRALTDGTLLGPAWAAVIASGKHPISPAKQNPDQAPSRSTLVGYGTEERIIGTGTGQRAYGHTGGLLIRVAGSSQPGGGSTSLSIYPDLDVVAVVLSNYYLYPGIGTFLAQQDRIIGGGA